MNLARSVLHFFHHPHHGVGSGGKNGWRTQLEWSLQHSFANFFINFFCAHNARIRWSWNRSGEKLLTFLSLIFYCVHLIRNEKDEWEIEKELENGRRKKQTHFSTAICNCVNCERRMAASKTKRRCSIQIAANSAPTNRDGRRDEEIIESHIARGGKLANDVEVFIYYYYSCVWWEVFLPFFGICVCTMNHGQNETYDDTSCSERIWDWLNVVWCGENCCVRPWIWWSVFNCISRGAGQCSRWIWRHRLRAHIRTFDLALWPHRGGWRMFPFLFEIQTFCSFRCWERVCFAMEIDLRCNCVRFMGHNDAAENFYGNARTRHRAKYVD